MYLQKILTSDGKLKEVVLYTTLTGDLSFWFETEKPLNKDLDKITIQRRGKDNQKAKISFYISITNNADNTKVHFDSRYFKPRQILIDLIENNMLAIDYDQVFFEIIIRDNYTASLYAKYNQIIGSREICALNYEDVLKYISEAKKK